MAYPVTNFGGYLAMFVFQRTAGRWSSFHACMMVALPKLM